MPPKLPARCRPRTPRAGFFWGQNPRTSGNSDKDGKRSSGSCRPTSVKLLVKALALLAAGCSSGRHSTAGTGQDPLRQRQPCLSALGCMEDLLLPWHFNIRLPRDWHVAPFDGIGSSAATPLVAISNAPIGTASSRPSTSPTAVSAVWSEVGNDSVPFHPNAMIDGRRAQITTATPASRCPKGGPQARSISAMVVRDPATSSNYGPACPKPSCRPIRQWCWQSPARSTSRPSNRGPGITLRFAAGSTRGCFSWAVPISA